MGYYTRYALKCSDKALIKELIKENENAACAFSASGSPCEEIKWYEHEEELREFSKRYPDVLFTLKGEGEEQGDLWIKYFQNGKMQLAAAKIAFARFDKKKLV